MDMRIDYVKRAYERGIAATRRLDRVEQKELGQFMTPPGVARFMACRIRAPGERKVRVLDPAAGSGVLAAAAIERLLAHDEPPQAIELTMCELDARMAPSLRALAADLRKVCAARKVRLTVSIRGGDFLLSPMARARAPIADVIIANPPYFKLNASNERAQLHSFAVYGQPNIYGLFMAVCADLVAAGGSWCFITPRSWTNGAYFAAVRRHITNRLSLEAVHVFESRQDHFTDDEVLQEAIIAWASTAAAPGADVTVSSSHGTSDLDRASLHVHPVANVIGQDEERVIALPAGENEPWAGWTGTLGTYGLKVSTGPVVAFRAAKHLRGARNERTVPLLWMQHVGHMRVSWPIAKKREHIVANAETAWMLLPNENLVLMRRFSPKEDPRRITASAYLAGSLPGEHLGVENHLNYVYQPGGKLAREEALGLAAFLGSEIADRYLRMVAGSTQVNATDVRKLPLPSLQALKAIGKRLSGASSLSDADAAVGAVLGRVKTSRKTA